MNQLQYIHSYLIISPLYYPIFIPMKPSAKPTGAMANLLFVAIVHLNGLNGRSLLGPGSEMTGRWGWWLAGFDAHDFWGWKKQTWEGVTRKVVVSQGTRGITQRESRHATGPFSADTKP